MTKESSYTSEFLKRGLTAARKNGGSVVGHNISGARMKIADKALSSGKMSDILRNDRVIKNIPKGKTLTVAKDPSDEMYTARQAIRHRDKIDGLGPKGIKEKIKAGLSDIKHGFNYGKLDKNNKAAIRGATGFHEAAERKLSGTVAQSLAGQKNGHVSVSGIVGRTEHNNFRKPAFQKELKPAKDFMREVRSTGPNSEAGKLKLFTPSNKKNIKVEYGDPSSPRINRSLALRMQAKEVGVDLYGRGIGSKELKKTLREQHGRHSKNIQKHFYE